ncbi:MAG TPA: hypothetical protein VF189_06125 [Patescibacteria group bacterium]
MREISKRAAETTRKAGRAARKGLRGNPPHLSMGQRSELRQEATEQRKILAENFVIKYKTPWRAAGYGSLAAAVASPSYVLAGGTLGAEVISQATTHQNIPAAFIAVAAGCLAVSLAPAVKTVEYTYKWAKSALKVRSSSRKLKNLEWRLGENSDLMNKYTIVKAANKFTWFRRIAVGLATIGAFGVGAVAGGAPAVPAAIGTFIASNGVLHLAERGVHYTVNGAMNAAAKAELNSQGVTIPMTKRRR